MGKRAQPSLSGTTGGRVGILEAERDRSCGISAVRPRWVTPGQAVTPGTEGWGQAVSVGARAEAPKPVITFTLSC